MDVANKQNPARKSRINHVRMIHTLTQSHQKQLFGIEEVLLKFLPYFINLKVVHLNIN